MMKFQDEDSTELKKLGPVVRSLCLFLLAFSLFSSFAASTALIFESFHYIILIAVFVSLVTVHVSGSILFTGYAPSYLLFAHGKVRMDKP
jgi:hypothetical protein